MIMQNCFDDAKEKQHSYFRVDKNYAKRFLINNVSIIMYLN